MESTQSRSHPPTRSSPHNPLVVAGIWMLVLAVFLLLCGLSSAVGYLTAPFLITNRDNAIQVNIFLGAFAALGILFGAVWMWQGIVTLRGRAPISAGRAFPPVIVLVAAFPLTLALGLGAQAMQPIAAFAFPPFHFLAAALPPFVLLAYAARQLNVTSGLRALIVSLSWGAFGSPFLALSLEIISGVIIVGLAVIALALAPDGTAWFEPLRDDLHALQFLDEQTIVRRLLANPVVVAAAIAYFAVVIPVIEESVKTLIVAFADPARTSARDARLWGIAAGAGFAIVENALNTGGALDIWTVAMLTRVGATVMHTANGVTMARGWYAARVERRWSRLLLAYSVSVFLHAVWNALAIGLGIGAVFWLNEARAGIEVPAPLYWLGLAALLGLFLLAFGSVAWIAYSVRTVREPSSRKI